jgi:non-canonical purine NTP pyrophosphatase (RdgB/HAM1 family)
MVYFITGNAEKFDETKRVISEIERIAWDLDEIQEIDSRKIIDKKIKLAFEHIRGDFVVEDTSLAIKSIGGLPGPLIKWFLKTLGNNGIYKIVRSTGKFEAEAKVVLGYAKNKEEVFFFEVSQRGKIVAPLHSTNFGWDPLFQPDGENKSYAELRKENPDFMSVRKLAFLKLRDFLYK